MERLDFIVWFTLNTIIVPMIALGFFSAVLTPRVRKFIPFIPTMLASIVGNILLTYDLIPKTVYSLVFNACFILSIFVFYKNKPHQKLVPLVLYFMIVLTLDYSTFLFINSIGDTVPNSVAMLVFAVASALALCLAGLFLKKRLSGEINRKASVFLLVPISHVATYLSISYYESQNISYVKPLVENGSHFPAFSVLLMACFLFSLVIDIFVFRQYIKSLDAAKLQAQNEALEYKNKMNEQYFASLKDTELEFHKIRHDIGGSLQVVKELIYEEKKIDDAKKLFDSLSESVQNIHTGFYSNNSLVNAILVSKEKQCKNEHIPFEATVQIPGELTMDESDFCRILVNLLDNAMEANLAVTENRFLRITMQTEGDTLYIKTENPSNGELVEGTTKKDKTRHGYGLRILKDYAAKYDGTFTTEIKDNRFLALFTLQMPVQ